MSVGQHLRCKCLLWFISRHHSRQFQLSTEVPKADMLSSEWKRISGQEVETDEGRCQLYNLIDQAQEFLPRQRTVTEAAQHPACNKVRARFVHPACGHAMMGCF